jgi:putative membrane protein
MRVYNPKKWFDILFQMHRSDTLRKLFPMIIIISLYSIAAVYFEGKYVHLVEKNYLSNLPIFHSLLGFALSLLLVFRTNTAYDRWWEGRKLWGSLVNNSRNLAIKLQALLPPTDAHNRDFYKRMIPLYARVLKEHLQLDSTTYALSSFPEHEHIKLDYNKHTPNQVARMLHDRAIQLQRNGVITGEQLLYLNPELTSFTDICGACERIKNTPIPYSYSAFIKKFIFIYVMTLPFGYALSLGYWVVPVVAMVFYVLTSLEIIAEEIEDPFGTDSNDLPMDKISENIGKHVREIL